MYTEETICPQIVGTLAVERAGLKRQRTGAVQALAEFVTCKALLRSKAAPCTSHRLRRGRVGKGWGYFLFLILILLMILICRRGNCVAQSRSEQGSALHPLRRRRGDSASTPKPKPRKYRSRVPRLDRKMLIVNW